MANDSLLNRIAEKPLAAVVDYYAERLPKNARALAFLKRRRLSAGSELRVGFADRTLGKQLPTSYVKAGRGVRSLLTKAGVFKANGRERFWGLVTVPLWDLSASGSDVTGIYGLRIEPTGGENEITIGSGIFNPDALSRESEIILCASVLDAWTLCGCGYDRAIAIEGIELSGETFPASVTRVLLAGNFDHGLFEGKELLKIQFPEGRSIADYAQADKTLDDPLGKRIRAAQWISGAAPERTEKQTIKVEATENKEATEEEETSTQPTSVPGTSPVRHRPHDDLPVEHNEHETIITIENRRWRIRGLERNTAAGVMRVNIALFNDSCDRFHVDTLDLYHARARRSFLAEAAEETALGEYDLRSDLARVLMKLDQLQHEQQHKQTDNDDTVSMSDEQRAEAMALLTDERLLDRILEDFETCGIVGEEPGKLAGYLAATSRLLSKPLGLVIQSSSAAGKSALADSVLKLMPPESIFRCSALTGQSLFYLGKENLKHKILSIAEEEGARESSYQLKLLQSEGSLSLVATSKESGTGRTSTERYEVRGPVALMMTTTSLSVDPELLNRCLVITIDESAAQTEAILQRQRRAQTLAALRRQCEQEKITRVHHNAQRLLRPLRIVNPFAEQLGFISSQTRHRRDHQKYLTLIQAVTLLHQYQHEVKRTTVGDETIEYIEVTRDDIARANTIADWALGRSIDELAGPTRRLLIELYDWLRELATAKQLEVGEIEFTRRQVRETLGWSATQLGYHLEQLCLHEYTIRAGGGVGKLCKYRLLYDGRGREGQATVIGLVDAASLVDPKSDPTTDDLSGS